MSEDQRPRPSRIPDFQNREEEAEWWDTHDLSDYWDELRPTDVRVAPDLTSEHRLTVRLAGADQAELDRRARDQGVGPSALVRRWIKERLRQKEPTGQPTG